ncbi:MAG: hypothetical protein QOA57_01395 [Nitrososphaeraceae archaeon]|nr:hypothetical protein [Nitrososphaeraceae archaeon]MDW0292215.1 hypothetical protein [Nitrososphaeraceae archaeon]MDW3666785.1 hypothetical protein [Nitrososphaeraceae archaeon]
MVDLQTRITCRLTISVNFPINTITVDLQIRGLPRKISSKDDFAKNLL